MLKSFYIDKLKPFLLLLFLVTFLFTSLLSQSYADSSQNIPPRPCDFYGIEESPQTLKVGSIIVAKDPQGVVVGQFTITDNTHYGFLTCASDNPNTPEDEGAMDGDIITFYIDGIKQQKQAVW
ncbi:MAG: hypothetical protein NG737_07345, partial [Omnitrophica bacterium]|nr:hypothetical protein [Candidatus Omnitrophota bacterium]